MTTTTTERTENARLVRESAEFVVSPERLRRVRAVRYQTPGFDRNEWKEFADLGWFNLRIPEARGGTGFGTLELCALAEQLGSGLVSGPVVAAIASAALAPEEWLDKITGGEMIMVPAWQEERGIFGHLPRTRLSGGRLNGEKRYVSMAGGADAFLVTTQEGLAFVLRNASGLSVSTEVLQDGSHFGTLRFAESPAIAVAGDFGHACEEITLATAAYLLGAMRKAFAMTADYLATRKQFGKPIGSFQSLQHRMVDLHIQIELTRASIGKAAGVLDGTVDGPRQEKGVTDAGLLAVSRAKARASDSAMLVTRQAIQLHGAIGYTDAHDAGLYLRKALVLAHWHGSAAAHRARSARLSGS